MENYWKKNPQSIGTIKLMCNISLNLVMLSCLLYHRINQLEAQARIEILLFLVSLWLLLTIV